jgi:protein-disulfide isomerase
VTATRREPSAAVVPAPDDHVLGNPLAPVTVVEYGDYECPYCAAAAPVLRRLVEESDGQVRLVFRNFPLADRHPYALTAALAAEAAGAQGAFWPMHDLLFARQERLDDASLRAYAEELGLEGDRVVGEVAQPFADKVEKDFAAALAVGVGGTPTVFIDGRLFDGRMELGALRRAVSGGDGGLDPGAGRQRRWPLGLRRAQREAPAEDPQQDDPGDRCDS